MNSQDKLTPCLFEVSWEVCNKVGGIHTVVSTKALSLSKEYGNGHILIGPDIWHNSDNNEFIPDNKLYKELVVAIEKEEGIKVKVGHWDIESKPIVILVDFSSLISKKDQIFTELWEEFKLDSLTGQWDYIEPALFGYATGKVIESFVNYNLSGNGHNVTAQFHEWMTGVGLLYLKNAKPDIATAFTTHATVLGRCIAGNHLPLYEKMPNYSAIEQAQRFNVTAKFSLEKTAAYNSDVFTTVSDITAKECKYLVDKKVDLVTPNGFESKFVPEGQEFENKRKIARKKFLEVASTILGYKVNPKAFIVGTSGRYEFKNKGIDVFINALDLLQKENSLKKEILAFIMVPAGHRGADINSNSRYTTHILCDEYNDPVMQKVKELNFTNSKESKVKIIFVPSYLQGDDGIFNLSYYDLLIGMDTTVFPSYYEPWGYTPLESVAFSVPTITTTLAGFGLWVNERYNENHPAVTVIERDDYNDSNVAQKIADGIKELSSLAALAYQKVKENALEISKIALWENLVNHYNNAYKLARERAELRTKDYTIPDYIKNMDIVKGRLSGNGPTWVSVVIHKSLPEKLKPLETIATNFWWSWNNKARDIFRVVDYRLWKETKHNPIAMMDRVSYKRYQELAKDEVFLKKLNEVYAEFLTYMEGKKNMSGPGIAYFSMEYGIHTSLKIYSGGLGVLAGDYIKEASDKGTKLTAVGLLYKYGYFTQKISAMGDQEAVYEAQDFMKIAVTPVRDEDGNWVTLDVDFSGRTLKARVWRADIGRVELYLMDTDYEDNLDEDKSVTHQLYGGDWENRLKQELLLGCGGIQLLDKLGIKASVYHCNEGHAAFMGIERIANLIEKEGLTFGQAIEVVRSSSLFTTHTPVPAGHDAFSDDLLRAYISHFTNRLHIDWNKLMGLGKLNAHDINEKFSMSFLAANIAQEINGVSMLHGKVSKEILKDMWPGYMAEENHVGYVTNGVHYPTWTAPEWKKIHLKVFGDDFKTHHYDKKCFDGIYEIPDSEIWGTRQTLRSQLILHIKKLLKDVTIIPYYSPSQLIEIEEKLRDDVLTIGFARRFATYKRAHLLFRNLDRLSAIVNNPKKPVQFIFAGKAHPADKAGQDLIKRIVEVSKMPQFLGKILFVPNYDMDLAKKLVRGVDIWMNTPTRPLEASGTSGEKAAMNGVMHFSVLDGWWVEGYRPDSGWKLPERTYQNQDYQNELDAEMIYSIFENDITPRYYDDLENGLPVRWINMIKNTIAKVASNFTTNRMLIDYEKRYYEPLATRYNKLINDNFKIAKEIAEWKEEVRNEWNNIELVHYSLPEMALSEITLGQPYKGDVILEIGSLNIKDVGVELVMVDNGKNGKQIRGIAQFTPSEQTGSRAVYIIEYTPENPGLVQVAVRIYPKNELLPHRQDFTLIKWL